MKIRIICVGKLKEKYLKDGIAEYAKRLSRFCSFEIAELSDEKIPSNPSDAQCLKVLESEGDAILKKMSPDAYVIALCVEGKQLSSEKFAWKMSDIMLSGKSTVEFIIGGSLGLADSVKQRCDFKLSISEFTFPHQLMRLILSEQRYRSFKINSNEEYHK